MPRPSSTSWLCPHHAGRRVTWSAALPGLSGGDAGRPRQWLKAAVDFSVEQQGGALGRRASLAFLRAAWDARAEMAVELRQAAVLARVVASPPA